MLAQTVDRPPTSMSTTPALAVVRAVIAAAVDQAGLAQAIRGASR